MTKNQPMRFVWIDCEMTGLDPQRDHLLEIATFITDEQLHEIAAGPDLVIHQEQAVLEVMDPYVRSLHQSSGLLAQVEQSTVSLAQAEALTADFIAQHCTGYTAYLAGNSVWQDARFLRAYMPRVMQQLHYRMLDVSSFKLAVQAWYGPDAVMRKGNAHRALDDIRESVKELGFYRKEYFR